MAASIGGSVGRKGENREPDVEMVQKLLAVRGFDPGLADGICGPLTIGAIVSSQRGFLRQPDGLRAGSVCLDRFSGLIGGVSAGFRPPRSAAGE